MKTAVRATRLARLLIAGALTLLAVPTAAGAATAHLQNRAGGVEELGYDARPGEVNRLLLTYDSYSRVWSLYDPAGITAGRGCTVPDPANPVYARCTVAAGARASGLANVDLGDRDDAVAVLGPGVTRAVLTGGPGDDVLTGGREDDAFWQGNRADGADRVTGGSGNDAMDYSGRRAAVTARVGGPGGERGEGDSIAGDVEGLTGGSGGDSLRGNARENVLVGGAGADRMAGGPGYDILVGGPGNDGIRARDGSIDDVTCGPGADRARLDGLDFFTGGCERVGRDRAAGATVIYISYDDAGRLLADVGCPEDTPVPSCKGRLTMAVDGRSIGHNHLDLARGARGVLTFQLPPDVAQRLAAGGRTTAMTVLASRMGRIHRKVRVRWSLPLRG